MKLETYANVSLNNKTKQQMTYQQDLHICVSPWS